MKLIKKVWRLFALMCIIVLASVGVALSGGIPPAFSKRRDEDTAVKIELVDIRKSEEGEEKD